MYKKLYNYFGVNYVSNRNNVDKSVSITNSYIDGNVIIGKNSKIYKAFICVNNLEIGKYSSLWGPNIFVYSILNTIKIGSYTSIARNVSIQEYNHKTDCMSTYLMHANIFNEGMNEDVVSKGPIVIGNDVWIASNVVIGSGVTIGDGAVIGANSTVLQNVPAFSIVAGSPAKIIRYRFENEIIQMLMKIKWWDWTDYEIKKNKRFFLNKLTKEELRYLI